jgi:polynucleotide 5'-kinase involved in rRNA processing
MELDPGQPTHGVPGTFNLVEKSGRRICQYFLGELSPARNPADVLLGVNVLSRRVQAGGLVIDTSGFVSGELAIRLKLAKAILSRCDAAVVFESDSYDFQKFSNIFSSVGMSVFHARIPDSVRKFSPEERRRRRELIFKEFFEGAVEFEAEFGLEQVFGLPVVSEENLSNRYFALEDRKLVCEAIGLIKQAEVRSSRIYLKGMIVGKPSRYTHIKISTLSLNVQVNRS